MREQTERNARTRSRDERVKFREGAASLFWRRFRGEARVSKQRRAAVVVQAVAVSLVSNSRFCTASDKEEVLTVSRRSVEAEARKSLDLAVCRLHVLARDNVDATLSLGLHQKWRALCCLRPRRAAQPWATRAGGCGHCWLGRCSL